MLGVFVTLLLSLGYITSLRDPWAIVHQWAKRLARNAQARAAPGVEITLFDLPSPFATFLGLSIL